MVIVGPEGIEPKGKRRDELKATIYGDLKSLGIMTRNYLPYRRGCKQFEKVLGDWHGRTAGQKSLSTEGSVKLEQLKEN